MVFESVVVAAVLAIGLLVLLGRGRRPAAASPGVASSVRSAEDPTAETPPGRGGRVVAAGVLIISLAVPVFLVFERDSVYPVDTSRPSDAADRPVQDPREGFATSDTCRSCHPRHHASWDHSYHRKMTQSATPDAVVGAFNGETISFGEDSYRFTREGDEYWVEMDDPAWRRKRDRARAQGWEPEVSEEPHRVTRPVALVTGSHKKQIYWYPTGMSRVLGQVELYWLTEEQQWIPRSAGFLSHPDRPTPPETGRWNAACIRCHATDGRPGIESPRAMDSRASELTIGCESCHGPAQAHVDFQRNPANRYASHVGGRGDDHIVNPADLSTQASAQVCGQCHGLNEFKSIADALRWEQEGFDYRPGDNLDDTRITVRHDPDPPPGRIAEAVAMFPYYMENRFWSDGMIRLAGREYNGLIETSCHTEGAMDCLSCHSMHGVDGDPQGLDEWRVDQLKPGMRGNEACLQCHTSFGDDVTAHTFHAPDSSGSNCLNCHMSYTGYGLLQAVRSHEIDNPSVATSLMTGRPNACNQCHLDQTLGWTADHMQEWYGTPRPELTEPQETVAASLLWLLQGEPHVRALMAWSMGWDAALDASGRTHAGAPPSDEWMVPFLGQLLEDPYDAVRLIAHRSLKRHEGFEHFAFEFLGPTPFWAVARERVWRQWSEARAASGDGQGSQGNGAQGNASAAGAASGNAPPGNEAFIPALLVDLYGLLREDVIAELLKDRDNRPTHLQE